MGRLTSWAVREALAFAGVPMTAWALARQLEEPLRDVVVALHRLFEDGAVRYVGDGKWATTV